MACSAAQGGDLEDRIGLQRQDVWLGGRALGSAVLCSAAVQGSAVRSADLVPGDGTLRSGGGRRGSGPGPATRSPQSEPCKYSLVQYYLCCNSLVATWAPELPAVLSVGGLWLGPLKSFTQKRYRYGPTRHFNSTVLLQYCTALVTALHLSLHYTSHCTALVTLSEATVARRVYTMPPAETDVWLGLSRQVAALGSAVPTRQTTDKTFDTYRPDLKS
jgi:hypothetical protein